MSDGDRSASAADEAAAIRARLAELAAEQSRLEDALQSLEAEACAALPLSPASLSVPMQPADKVALFLHLFAARRSVFPKFWENRKSGKQGYAPACDNEWRQGVCEKPRIKCSECPHQRFPPLDAQAIEAHLRGVHTIGTYAIREDDSCNFLAADFDGEGWREDVLAFHNAGATANVLVAIERSQSGNGAHAWIFFAEPVPRAACSDRCERFARTRIRCMPTSARWTCRPPAFLPTHFAEKSRCALMHRCICRERRFPQHCSPVSGGWRLLPTRSSTRSSVCASRPTTRRAFIFAGEWHRDRLVLPRGLVSQANGIIEDAGGTVTVHDVRPVAPRVRWKFSGELRPEQERAVRAMMQHEHGVLSAPPGAGKTVMGCALIARHRTSALVLVHRTVLVEQWRQEAVRFLGLARKEVGAWRGSVAKLTGRLDIAMLPSLARAKNPADVFAHYRLVIVDECHHVPAVSFEALLKTCTCRHIVGLTATPQRKDGPEKLLHMQCGPIRHTLGPAMDDAVARTVFVRRSSFQVPETIGVRSSIHEIWRALVCDTARTELIAADIVLATQEGRSPLVLSDRKAHLEKLAESFKRLRGDADVAVLRLSGEDGLKDRRAVREEIEGRSASGRQYVLFATAALIGEGFDLPQLDTLFLAMPLSFKGRLVQYAGRLHRTHADKRDVRIHDYLDENHAITQAMFRRRVTAYREMGYRFSIDENFTPTSAVGQLGLFSESGGRG